MGGDRVSRKRGGKKKAKSPYVAANSYIKNAHTETRVHKQMLIQKMHVKTKYSYDSSQSVIKKEKKKECLKIFLIQKRQR